MENGNKFVGFRLSYMDNDPRYCGEVQRSSPPADAPDELVALRKKIAGMTLFMSSAKFAKMTKNAKLEYVMDFAELNAIECGYARAVETNAGGIADMRAVDKITTEGDE